MEVPAASIAGYQRLIDLLDEESTLTSGLYVDMKRQVTASLVDESEES